MFPVNIAAGKKEKGKNQSKRLWWWAHSYKPFFFCKSRWTFVSSDQDLFCFSQEPPPKFPKTNQFNHPVLDKNLIKVLLTNINWVLDLDIEAGKKGSFRPSVASHKPMDLPQMIEWLIIQHLWQLIEEQKCKRVVILKISREKKKKTENTIL